MSALANRIQELDWQKVNSTNVAAVAYDLDWKRLFVQYNSKEVVAYDDVPASVWKSMLAASSVGAFVYDIIRGANGKRANHAKGIPAPNLDYIYSYRALGRHDVPMK